MNQNKVHIMNSEQAIVYSQFHVALPEDTSTLSGILGSYIKVLKNSKMKWCYSKNLLQKSRNEFEKVGSGSEIASTDTLKRRDAKPEPLEDARSEDDCFGMLFKYLVISTL